MSAIVIPFRSRAARRPLAAALCELSTLAESAMLSQWRVGMAWQRVMIRTMLGV
ncbi:MAG: hypothetical protein H6948_16115 [Zoogloeaceae bacterium]|nr:hypothetical protein [Zoogloeaceae bacterium]